MKKILALFFLLIMAACHSSSEASKSDRAIDKMTRDFAILLSQKGFCLMGLGGGLDHSIGKHNKIDIILSTSQQICDISIARKLLVETLVEFLNFINSSENIQEYLAVTPMTIANVHVSIICDHVQPGMIVDMSNCQEMLYYYMQNTNISKTNWILIHQEIFEEALGILSEEGIFYPTMQVL